MSSEDTLIIEEHMSEKATPEELGELISQDNELSPKMEEISIANNFTSSPTVANGSDLVKAISEPSVQAALLKLAQQTYITDVHGISDINHKIDQCKKTLDKIQENANEALGVDKIDEAINKFSHHLTIALPEDILIAYKRQLDEKKADLDRSLDEIIENYSHKSKEMLKGGVLNAEQNFQNLLKHTYREQNEIMKPFQKPYKMMKYSLYLSFFSVCISCFILLFLLSKFK